MSLTSLIREDEYLRNKISDDFQLPVLRLKFEKSRPLLAPPNTTNSRLVGVAFDYLLRFYLERLNGLPYDRENQWVAETGKNILSESCESTRIEKFERLEQESIKINQCSQRELMIASALSLHYSDSVLLSAYDHSLKIIKKLELPLSDFCQIIGYLLLHRIGGITSHSEEFTIEQLGIYYSRYGYLFVFHVKDLINHKSLDKFTIWFEKYVGNQKGKII